MLLVVLTTKNSKMAPRPYTPLTTIVFSLRSALSLARDASERPIREEELRTDE